MTPRLLVSRPLVVACRQTRSLTKTRLTRVEQSDSVGDRTPVTRRQKLDGGSLMKLYVFLGSPRAFNVMAVANHLGIEYQTQALNPAKGEHLASAYAAINPN